MNRVKTLLVVLAVIQFGILVWICTSHRQQIVNETRSASGVDSHFVIKEGALRFAKVQPEIFKHVGPYGYVEYSIPFGDVTLGDTRVAISLNLDSCLENSFSPFIPIPGDWWCPLFQSIAIPITEDSVSVDMVDGESFWLFRRHNSYDEYESEDGQWSGKKTGYDELTLVNASGAEFVYKGGLLHEVRTKKGTYDWTYNEAGEVSIKSKQNGRQLAALTNAKSRGVAQKKVIIGSETNLIMLSKENKNPDGEASVCGVKLASERSYLIHSSKGPSIESTSIETDDGTSLALEWDVDSGLVKKVGGWTYAVAGKPNGDLEIARTNLLTGNGEKLTYQESGRIAQLEKGDGTILIARKSIALGPEYGRPVKIEQMRDRKKSTIFEATYESDGRLARSWDVNNGEFVYEYDGQGRVKTILKNGKPIIRRAFDELGRIASFEDDERHIEYELAYLDSGQVRVSTKSDGDNKEDVVPTDSTLINQLNTDLGSRVFDSKLMLCDGE